ncbi:unnamed protein product [Phytomonas sp. EM1]|nr:unnamed protein product [Phytomonas sp. EM1]|eukprot:CCW60400.1 unnamed protein product [Phytomonas sp. isolate EM1]
MVRRGRWHCSHRDASGGFVEVLVARCRQSLSTSTDTGDSGEASTTDSLFHSFLLDVEADEACTSLLEDDVVNNVDGEDGSDGEAARMRSCCRIEKEGFHTTSTSARVVEEASRFVAYHCHHVLTDFRFNRKTWFNQHKRQQRQEHPERGNPPPGTTLPGLSHSYSAAELGMLMDYAFQASVLLHLTGLYEVGEKYLEPLLDVCLSVSIFLSQAHNFSRHNIAQKRNRESRGTGYDVLLDPSLNPHWDSLRWAVVHYCEAVRLWELLDHTAPLFSVDRTREPFGRLLQAHAGLITQTLGPQGFLREDWNHFMLLRAGSENQKRSMAIAQWFGEFGYRHGSAPNEEGGPGVSSSSPFCLFSQQRRLQLLPKLWLTMLGAHIQRGETAPQLLNNHPSDNCAKLLDSLDGVRSYPDKREIRDPAKAVTWCAARHSLLHLLPLFSREAKADASLWALLQLFYVGSDRCRSGRVELAALLSSLERHGMMRDFVPSSSTYTVLNNSSGTNRVRFLLQRWLRSRSCCSPAPSPQVDLGLSEPLITTLTGMYVAFTKLPLCVLLLTPEEGQNIHGSKPSPKPTVVTNSTASGFDGLHFLNVLLYRILIQWRSSGSNSTVRGAGLSMLSQRFQRFFRDRSVVANDSGNRAVALSKHIQIRSECCAELVFMLRAARCLHRLHQCIIRMQHQKTNWSWKQAGGSSDEGAKGGAFGMAGALLLVIEAATRGFAMQLGEVVFPLYLAALQESVESTLSAMERDLLEALHTILTNILVRSSAKDAQEADASAIFRGREGDIPSTYYEGIEALFSRYTS